MINGDHTATTNVNTIRRVGALLAPYRAQLLAALGLAVLACLLNLPVPLLVQGLVDRDQFGLDLAVGLDALQSAPGLLAPALHDIPPRRVGEPEQDDADRQRRHGGQGKHPAPRPG